MLHLRGRCRLRVYADLRYLHVDSSRERLASAHEGDAAESRFVLERVSETAGFRSDCRNAYRLRCEADSRRARVACRAVGHGAVVQRGAKTVLCGAQTQVRVCACR